VAAAAGAAAGVVAGSAAAGVAAAGAAAAGAGAAAGAAAAGAASGFLTTSTSDDPSLIPCSLSRASSDTMRPAKMTFCQDASNWWSVWICFLRSSHVASSATSTSIGTWSGSFFNDSFIFKCKCSDLVSLLYLSLSFDSDAFCRVV
jgi:membrane protease subunit (stomatin/prohibitin family)